MAVFSDQDIHYGAGAFEQAMRTQSRIPGYASKVTPATAVGVLSAGMRSGMPANLFEGVIDQHFARSAALLKRMLAMYEGDDWSINLWHRLPTGRYKLCTALCYPGLPQWRYDPSLQPDIG